VFNLFALFGSTWVILRRCLLFESTVLRGEGFHDFESLSDNPGEVSELKNFFLLGILNFSLISSLAF